jgi:hypothetical protein
MTPSSTSPAIDAGDDAVCPAVDYLGLARPVDGDGDGDPVCDIGAYEVRPLTSRIYLPLALRG